MVYKILYMYSLYAILNSMDIQLKDRIRKIRENNKLTQADVAGQLKVSRLTYISIETGDKKPTIDQLEAIGAILGVTTHELLFPDEETNSKVSLAKYRQMCQACIQYGSANDGKITKTKLAKLLYLVDFSWFAIKGTSMSGLGYRALPRGPVADQFFQMTDEMFESGQVQIESKGAALLFSNTEQPSYVDLSTDELAHIQKIAEKWRSADTQTIVDFTHRQSPWTSTAPGLEIPYELAKQIPSNQLY
jgi:transcriptional regulator with XRE-family HTH domain